MKLYYYRPNKALYESKVTLIKPFECFEQRLQDVSLKSNEIIISDLKGLRKKPNILLTKEDVINELRKISSSEIMDFSLIYNLMCRNVDINTQELRDILKDYLSYFYYEDSKVCPFNAMCGLLRLTKSFALDSDKYAKDISAANYNTSFLNNLGIDTLEGYQLTRKY